MADEDDASKTEEPTDKKLSKAREQGQVNMSQEVKIGFLLLGSAFAVFVLLPPMMVKVERIVVPFIDSLEAIPVDPGALRMLLARVALDVAVATWPLFVLLVVLAVVSTVGQIGLLWAPAKLRFKLEVLDPIAGMKRLFGIQQIVEFLKGVVKAAVVGAIAFLFVVPLLVDMELIPTMTIPAMMDRLRDIALWMTIGTVIVMVIVAGLDWFWQKYSFTKKMRMTKSEIKDEHKQAEGDPQIKAKIRSLRVMRARQRMMAAVPKASVVVTNPTHYAVALLYEMDEMAAPRLVAKGVDHLALRIREVAEENDVPIVENPPLARALYATVEIDQEIPPEHYKAVAEIIGYVMRIKGKMPGAEGRPGAN
jgi:flagellar biosynthetic protein FlhB